MGNQRDEPVGDPAARDPLHSDDPVGPNVDSGAGSAVDSEAASAAARVRSRLTAPFGNLFSLRLFLVVLAITVVGMILANLLVPLPGAGIAGIAIVGFVVGLAHPHRRYLELLLAGLVAAGFGTVFEYALLTLVGGIAPVALGTTAGGIAAVAGHYFGRDLRTGLTKEL